MSASMTSFVYIGVLCFSVSAENNQIALIIIQLFGIAIFEITIYFHRCHFFDKRWTKDIFDVDMPTVVSKSS